MDEILDSNINTLPQLVEEYISHKRNRLILDTSYFKYQLKQLGYSPEQIHEIMIEMDDDADRELLAGEGSKKAKIVLLVSLIVGFLVMILCIILAIGAFGSVSSGVFFFPFGLFGASLIIAGRAYNEIGLVEKRKKRRFLKYRNWG